MTTAIPDIADLVKVLREQPEWAETLRAILLTQELLELPEKLARLTTRVEEFIAQQTETNRLVAEQLAQLTEQQARLAEQQARLTEQLERLTARVEEFIAQQKETNRLVAEQLAQLTEQQARLTEQQAQLTEQLARLTARVEEFIAEQKETNKLIAERLARQEADTAELKADMSEVKADVAELKADMSGLKDTTGRLETDMSGLKDTTGRLETDMSGLKDTVGRMQGTVGRLEGAELERKVHANIAGLVSNPLGIRRPRVLKSLVLSSVPELFDILHPAQDDGRIDRDQFDSLMRADIIMSGRDLAAQPLYVVIEISRTVHDYDVTRARERADIMAAAGGEPTLALVIGYIIPPPQRRKAEELGVHLMQSAHLEDGLVG